MNALTRKVVWSDARAALAMLLNQDAAITAQCVATSDPFRLLTTQQRNQIAALVASLDTAIARVSAKLDLVQDE